MNKIYHYYINYPYNRLSLKTEQFETPNSRYLNIYAGKYPHRLPMSSIGKLENGKTLYLLERNDELAIRLFNLYVNQKIASLTEDLNRFKRLDELVKNNEITLED